MRTAARIAVSLAITLLLLLVGCDRSPETPAPDPPKDELAFLRESKPRLLGDRLQLERALKGNEDALYDAIKQYMGEPSRAADAKFAAMTYLERQAGAGNWRAAKTLVETTGESEEAAVKTRRVEQLKSTLQSAVESGDPAALVVQGLYANAGKYWPKDQKLACLRWDAAAAKGYPMGLYLSGRCAETSLEHPSAAPDAAVRLYLSAADKGSIYAAKELVRIYKAKNDNEGVRKVVARMLLTEDPNDALQLDSTADRLCPLAYKKACRNPGLAAELRRQGVDDCQPCSQQSIDDAIALLKRAVELGSGSSAMSLADYYRDIDGSVEVRYFQWLLQAAELEDAKAMREMGEIASDGGRGMPLDQVVASNWFKKAAVKGDAQAQWRLGVRLANGVGIARDPVAAYAWLNLASSERFLTAAENARAARDTVARSLSPAEIAKAQALSSKWKPGYDVVDEPVSDAPTRSNSGTFFYVSLDGKAITNSHVIVGCKELKLPSPSRATVRVLASDSANDLALLQISDAPPVRAMSQT